MRAGHTEGSIDLVRTSGKHPAAVVCEIMNDDGTMARRPQLEDIAKKHDIPIVSIADIIAYRLNRESFVQRVQRRICQPAGAISSASRIVATSILPNTSRLLWERSILKFRPLFVSTRECLTGDIFGSQRCDCGEQLDAAMSQIAEEGVGALVYMRQEGRGIGLINKLKAYRLQDNGLDTVEANNRLGLQTDLRHYGVGAQILLDLGIRKFRFLTNNPKKVAGLEGFGLEMVEQIPLMPPANDHNRKYLKTKRDRMMHQIEFEDEDDADDGQPLAGPVVSRRRTRLSG